MLPAQKAAKQSQRPADEHTGAFRKQIFCSEISREGNMKDTFSRNIAYAKPACTWWVCKM